MPKRQQRQNVEPTDAHPFEDVILALPVRRPPLAKRRPGEPVTIVDLFAGAGGTSSGIVRALRGSGHPINLVTVNHWEVACATMRANYPGATVFQHGVDTVDPGLAVPGGQVDLLVASPECTTFSSARGYKPIKEQSRSSAAFIYEWLCHPHVQVDNFVIENVSEWKLWGPLDDRNRPLPGREGEYFESFIQEIRKLGYRTDHRVLNAADYGDATSRRRLFVIGRSDSEPVLFPTQTHAEKPGTHKTAGLEPWVPARDVIDWSKRGRSVFDRAEGPHSPKSVRRMRAGFEKQSTALAPAYVEALRRFEEVAKVYDRGCKDVLARYPDARTNKDHAAARRAEKNVLRERARQETIRTFREPVGEYHLADLLKILDEARRTQVQGTDGGTRVTSMLMGQHGGSIPRDTTTGPAMTIATRGAVSKFDGTIVDATMLRMNDSETSTYRESARTASRTKTTIVARDCTGLAVPVASSHPTVPSLNPEPFVSQQRGFYREGTVGYSATSIDRTVSGITAHTNHHALVSPESFISHLRGFFNKGRLVRSASSIGRPIDAIAANGLHHGLVEPIAEGGVPWLTEPHWMEQSGKSADDCREKHSRPETEYRLRPHILIDGRPHAIDVLFRMMTNSELARFTGFHTGTEEYVFTGSASDVTRQIGNAVPVRVAQALAEVQLRHYTRHRTTRGRTTDTRQTRTNGGRT